jgi:hypothetical protein
MEGKNKETTCPAANVPVGVPHNRILGISLFGDNLLEGKAKTTS